MIKSFIFVFYFISANFAVKDSDKDSNILEDVVFSIERTVEFYQNTYLTMNLDGIFGLRLFEGQMSFIKNHMRIGQHRLSDDDSALLQRLTVASQIAKNLSDNSLSNLKKNDYQYFMLMNRVVQRPWTYARSYRHINSTLRWSFGSNHTGKAERIKEEDSDICMSELMGGKDHPACELSSGCVHLMSAPGMDGYDITHQLLYTMLAEESGCVTTLNRHLQHRTGHGNNLPRLQEELCTNTFFETSQDVVRQRGIVKTSQDLFLEQEFVCSMLGYTEFLHIFWLRQIISWQKSSGCWSEVEPMRPANGPKQSSVPKHDSKMLKKTYMDKNLVNKEVHVDSRQNGNPQLPQSDLNNQETFINRKLLYEKSLEGRCLAHKTAVALGALSQYARFILLADQSNFSSEEILYGVNYLLEPNKIASTIQQQDHSKSVLHVLKTLKTVGNVEPLPGDDVIDDDLNKDYMKERDSSRTLQHEDVQLEQKKESNVYDDDNDGNEEDEEEEEEEGGEEEDGEEEDGEGGDNADYAPDENNPQLMPRKNPDKDERANWKNPREENLNDENVDDENADDNYRDYNYGEDEPVQKALVANSPPLPPFTVDSIKSDHGAESLVVNEHSLESTVSDSVGMSYAVLTLVMLSLVFILYKLIRKHRIFGMHRYSRWK